MGVIPSVASPSGSTWVCHINLSDSSMRKILMLLRWWSPATGQTGGFVSNAYGVCRDLIGTDPDGMWLRIASQSRSRTT